MSLAGFLRYLWVAPCSLVGMLAAVPALAFGARARVVAGVLEVALPPHWGARRWPVDAITLGHVVIGTSRRALAATRPHERVHVRQYERWGPAFFPAYLLAGAWQWARGRCAYRDNPFEVQARRG